MIATLRPCIESLEQHIACLYPPPHKSLQPASYLVVQVSSQKTKSSLPIGPAKEAWRGSEQPVLP